MFAYQLYPNVSIFLDKTGPNLLHKPGNKSLKKWAFGALTFRVQRVMAEYTIRVRGCWELTECTEQSMHDDFKYCNVALTFQRTDILER